MDLAIKIPEHKEKKRVQESEIDENLINIKIN